MTTATGTCWADPLSRAERTELARKLANACHRFASAPEPRRRRRERRPDYDPMAARMARRMASAEMSDLHLDVTERAELAADDPRRARYYPQEGASHA